MDSLPLNRDPLPDPIATAVDLLAGSGSAKLRGQDALVERRLGAWLREHPDSLARLELSRVSIQLLADEMARLRQSSDRLRHQNAKLRRRIERLKAAGDAAGDEAPALDEEPTPRTASGDGAPE